MLDLENSTPSHNRNLLAFANAKINRLEDTIRFEERFWKGCDSFATEKQYSIIQKGLDKLTNELAELKSHKADLQSAIIENDNFLAELKSYKADLESAISEEK